MSSGETPAETPASPAGRIFISYKRSTDPDRALAQFLYDALTRRGHRVFKDVEGIPTGSDYEELISSEIAGSDFFVVLLSKSSTQRGWVPAETEMAKDSGDNAGHPKILPVRVAYTQTLPLRLQAAIGHLNHFEWRDDTDNEKLLDALAEAVGTHRDRDSGSTLGAASSGSPSRLARGEHFIVTESLWHAGGARESLAGTTLVPVVVGQETSLSVTRAAGPGFFRVRVLDGGVLEVAIWSGTHYRRVRSQPRKFVTMMEGDTHAWCFARHRPDEPILLKRPGGRNDPVVVTFDGDLVGAIWMIVHQRASLRESFLVVMRQAGTG